MIKLLKLLSNEKGLIILKKTILICFFVVITILFVACKSRSDNDIKLINVEESKSNDVNAYIVYEKEHTAYNKEDKPFVVKYVQISGLGNGRLENKINQALKESITAWINEDCEWLEESQITVSCKNPKYLSLYYRIESENSNGEEFESTFARMGITVDIQTGDRVYLVDLVEDIEGLRQKLQNYDYENEVSPPIDLKEADKIIHHASISEKEYFEETYKTDSNVYDFMFTYMRVKPSFYLTDNQLVITRDETEYNDVFIDLNQ
ncbi:MAG: hypothetical protein KIC94_20910 [Clostridiales bacterium]|nr:hypothetical protein [Clostridiales bacterium]